jgi:hypothetical protein
MMAATDELGTGEVLRWRELDIVEVGFRGNLVLLHLRLGHPAAGHGVRGVTQA